MLGRQQLDVEKLKVLKTTLEQISGELDTTRGEINKIERKGAAEPVMSAEFQRLLINLGTLRGELESRINGATEDKINDDLNIADRIKTIAENLSVVHQQFAKKYFSKIQEEAPLTASIGELGTQLAALNAITVFSPPPKPKGEKEKEKEKEIPKASAEEEKIAAFKQFLELTEMVYTGLDAIAVGLDLDIDSFGLGLKDNLTSAANALHQVLEKSYTTGEFLELRKPNELPAHLSSYLGTSLTHLEAVVSILKQTQSAQGLQLSEKIAEFKKTLGHIEKQVETYEKGSKKTEKSAPETKVSKKKKTKPKHRQRNQEKMSFSDEEPLKEPTRKKAQDAKKIEREKQKAEKEAQSKALELKTQEILQIEQRLEEIRAKKEAGKKRKKETSDLNTKAQGEEAENEEEKKAVNDGMHAEGAGADAESEKKESDTELHAEDEKKEGEAEVHAEGKKQEGDTELHAEGEKQEGDTELHAEGKKQEGDTELHAEGERKEGETEGKKIEGDAEVHAEGEKQEGEAKGAKKENKEADSTESSEDSSESEKSSDEEEEEEEEEKELRRRLAELKKPIPKKPISSSDSESSSSSDSELSSSSSDSKPSSSSDSKSSSSGSSSEEEDEEEEEKLETVPEFKKLTKERIIKLAYKAYSKETTRKPTLEEITADASLKGKEISVPPLKPRELSAIFYHILNRENSYDKLINFYAHQIAIIERDNNPDLEKLKAIVEKCEELRVQLEIFKRSLQLKKTKRHWTDRYGTPQTWDDTWDDRLFATDQRIDKLDSILMTRLDKRLSAIKLAGNSQIAHFSDKGEAIIPRDGETLEQAITRKVAEYTGPDADPGGHIAVDYGAGSKGPYVPSTERYYRDAGGTKYEPPRITGRWNDDHTKVRTSVHRHTSTGAICELHRNTESSKGSKTRRLGYILPDDFILKSAMAELQEFQKFVRPGPNKPVMALRGAMTKQEIEAYLIAGKILGIPVVNQTRTKVNISYFNSWTLWKTKQAEHRLNRTLANEGKSEALSWMSRRKSEKLEDKTVSAKTNEDDKEIKHRRLRRNGGSD